MSGSTFIFPQETIKRGSPFPQGQRYDIHFDPQRGFDTITEIKGISQSQLYALQQNIIAQGIECTLSLYLDMGELHVHDSTLEYTIDSWDFPDEDVNVDGLSHPTMIQLTDGDPDVYSSLRASLENNDDADDVYQDMMDLFDYDADDAATIERFYSLQQRGSTNYRVPQYSLRHTTNVSNRWQVNVADVGVSAIYTPAQFLTETTDSGLWIFPLPPRLQYKAAAIAPLGPAANYLWGWLKSGSSERTSANNRVDIVTTYTLQLWSTDYYMPFDGVYGSTPYY